MRDRMIQGCQIPPMYLHGAQRCTTFADLACPNVGLTRSTVPDQKVQASTLRRFGRLLFEPLHPPLGQHRALRLGIALGRHVAAEDAGGHGAIGHAVGAGDLELCDIKRLQLVLMRSCARRHVLHPQGLAAHRSRGLVVHADDAVLADDPGDHLLHQAHRGLHIAAPEELAEIGHQRVEPSEGENVRPAPTEAELGNSLEVLKRDRLLAPDRASQLHESLQRASGRLSTVRFEFRELHASRGRDPVVFVQTHFRHPELARARFEQI
mmetsp:Transcript_85865/g.277249  ORF Transcript_85865/g.277249 Transcript_85865/m.277249 type:complete len:266 (-) Transcript_85865:2209-3006(-)